MIEPERRLSSADIIKGSDGYIVLVNDPSVKFNPQSFDTMPEAITWLWRNHRNLDSLRKITSEQFKEEKEKK